MPTRAGLRALSLVARVKRDEVETALLLTLHAFLLLAAYSCIKPVREALILVLPHGAEEKIYTGVVVGIVTGFVVAVYARLATKPARNQLIIGITLFFATNLVGFYAWGRATGPTLALAIAFYLWISIFNMMLVAQFWAFANDLYTEQVAERVFPLIGVGASLGAVVGSWLADELIKVVGTMGMFLVAAGVLVVAAPLIEIINRHEPDVTAANVPATSRAGPATERGAVFRFILRDRYLTLIALFSLLFTVVRTNGEYVLATLIKHAAVLAVAAGTLRDQQVAEYIGTRYAHFGLYVNVGALVVQTFVVSRLLRRFGFGLSFMMFPIVALAGNAALLAVPVLAIAFPERVTENSIDYSVLNTARNLLWQPTTRRAKYVAKQAVDTFFVRAGDITSALFVFVGIGLVHASTRAFIAANLCAVIATLLVGRAVLAERARLLPPRPRPAAARRNVDVPPHRAEAELLQGAHR